MLKGTPVGSALCVSACNFDGVESFLVFGAGGQDGLILSRRLAVRGEDVTCLAGNVTSKIAIERYAPNARVEVVDIRDQEAVMKVVAKVKPTRVFNFAAISSVASSWSHPRESLDVNLLGVANIVTAIKANRDWDVKFFQSSSSEVFATSASPLHEGSPRLPRSPYGIGKHAADRLVEQYRENDGLFAASGIFFNHESPLRQQSFLTRHVSRGVAEIAAGIRDTIPLGNIDAVRDWGYAPDYVSAAELILDAPSPADYVVSSGTLHSVRDVLDVAFSSVGIADWGVHIETEEGRFRPADVNGAVGDSTRAQRELGWGQTRTFAETIAEMVSHDVDLIAQGVESLWVEDL